MFFFSSGSSPLKTIHCLCPGWNPIQFTVSVYRHMLQHHFCSVDFPKNIALLLWKVCTNLQHVQRMKLRSEFETITVICPVKTGTILRIGAGKNCLGYQMKGAILILESFPFSLPPPDFDLLCWWRISQNVFPWLQNTRGPTHWGSHEIISSVNRLFLRA